MNNTIRTIFLIFSVAAFSAAQGLTELRIISETGSSIVLEYRPDIKTEHVIGDDGTIFTRFRFFDSQIDYDSSGLAEFFRPVRILIPSSGYSVNLIEGDSYTKDSIEILPKPKLKHLEDFSVVESYESNLHAAEIPVPVDKKAVEIVRSRELGSGFVGMLLLRPVQFLGGEKFRIYTRMLVSVKFKNSLPAGKMPADLLLGKKGQINSAVKSGGYIERPAKSESSPLAQGEWYRFTIDKQGMYKLDYSFFNGLSLSIDNINSVRLFGNGGTAIPDSPDTVAYPRPNTLVEIPRIVVDKNSNGHLDSEDYIIFYGCGTRGWKYYGSGTFKHVVHPYTEHNYYFFTYDQGIGKQMDSISGLPVYTPISSPTNFQEKIFVEEEKYNLIASGRKWVGKLFYGADNSDTYPNSLPGLDASAQINYKFSVFHRSATIDQVYVYESDQLLRPAVLLSATSLSEGARYAEETDFTASRTGGVPNNSSAVRIQVSSSNSDAKTWLDWLEIFYKRKFEAYNDNLIFTTDDISGPVNYTLNNFFSGAAVFDISKHDSVKKITDIVYNSSNPGIYTFQLQQQGGSVRQIAVVGENGYRTISGAEKISNTANLHNTLNRYDFIIISPPEFISEANRLKNHRDSDTSQNRLQTIVVDINDVFNEFSGGLPDPFAIREFLMYAYRHWTPPNPEYVLLFGWGHYDYKSASPRNYIPPYESEESFYPDNSYTSDDQFVIFTPQGNACTMAIGRIPARNLGEAAVCVDKIISYENALPVDPWRNRITYVADDGKTSTGDEGVEYTNPTEVLAEDSSYTPNRFEKNKIYIVQYPTVNSSAGRRKPDANKNIVNSINDGTLIINYIGHGNLRLWAHEAIFTREDDIPKLINKDRLTFVVASTCSYGLYDNPKDISASERLLTMEQGGAVAVFSAARVVYNSPNVLLNQSLYKFLLYKNANGEYPRLGDALLNAKNENYVSYFNRYNDFRFHLFGDPTLKLAIPKQDVTVDSIEGRSLLSSYVVVKSLDFINVVGTVRRSNGGPMTEFNGTGIVRLFDSEKRIDIQDGEGANKRFIFNVSGSQLYGGEVSVNDGTLKTVIPIPKDVTYGQNARLSIYIWGNQNDGSGFTQSIIIDGTDTTAAIDTIGPHISIYMDDFAFHAGDVLKSNPLLIVHLEDQSGINTSSVGVGHQLSATIDNPDRVIDLSNYYRSNRDTYQTGEARYQLSDLSNGKYKLKIKAWDIQNNSSEAETFFEVNTGSNLEIMNVFNYPNPFSDATNFTFQRNSTDPVEVDVKIYTVAGRLICKLNAATSDRSVIIPWNGRDGEGALLANGVYFYKVIVHNQFTGKSFETIGKMAVLR